MRSKRGEAASTWFTDQRDDVRRLGFDQSVMTSVYAQPVDGPSDDTFIKTLVYFLFYLFIFIFLCFYYLLKKEQ